MWTPVALFAMCAGVLLTVAAPLPQVTFAPPFTAITADGRRYVPNWRVGGDASVKKNFIRLTPDRQSKRGFVWSESTIQSSELSLVLKFRISGQGKTLFGDGIGLWIVGGNGYVAGQFHGLTETFHGVGIVLDTFRNSENALVHKDVSIYVNDGTKHLDDELLHAERVGCDANIRYLVPAIHSFRRAHSHDGTSGQTGRAPHP
eukprot:TRINITY_DN5181_c0_g2_i2.p1 TRINITY_DN5181_c0_g2~~TRINITY_DN5181_c0_g2_i2.p1  ORF type:complete len:211 (+),score=28.43 TRINITY_DN5181_c0_g2_i2:27-635(+)